MRTEVTDELGTYSVNTQNKPQELETANAIYLNIFDNGEKENAARYKVVLSVVTDEGKHIDWTCSILNHFEPNQFYRPLPEQFKEMPFYRQIHQTINMAKKDNTGFDKKPSAGFFRLPRSKGMKKEQRKIIPNAIAMLIIEKDKLPLVSLRFIDYTFTGEVEETNSDNSRAPKWSVCLKSTTQVFDEDVNVDVSEYF